MEKRVGFEWIPNKSEPRSIEGMLSKYNGSLEEVRKYEKRLIKAYFRKHGHEQWAVEEAAKLEWSERAKSRMINKLRESVNE